MDAQGSLYNRLTQADLQDEQKLTQLNLKWSPALALFLFSDASMTRNFELVFRTKTKIKMLEEVEGITETSKISNDISKEIEGPHINRKILFLTEDDKVLMYAESIWNKKAYEELMKDKGDAIGANMRRQRFENFREILFAGTVQSDKEVNKTLDNEENKPVLFRSYYLWHQKEKVCVIQEYFSKEVNKALSLE